MKGDKTMKTKRFSLYWWCACAGTLLASCYPLWMGVRVLTDLIADGTVAKEHYPKYLIPYTPIAVAVIVGVLLMPLCLRWLRRAALVGGAGAALAVFFTAELLLEKTVVVSDGLAAQLEDWQMYMCWVPPELVDWSGGYRTQTAVDILMGDYNPAFKLHFYVISVVLILALLNCLYGFGQMIRRDEFTRCKSLTVQSVCTAVFLGLCILACFTAFWRDGNLAVSPLSAMLMSVFFILLGVTAGVFAASFLLGRRRAVSVAIPAAIAAVMTVVMYIGEMILLSGHLYQYGEGLLFESLPVIVLAPVDILIVLFSGGVTAAISQWLNRAPRKEEPSEQ